MYFHNIYQGTTCLCPTYGAVSLLPSHCPFKLARFSKPRMSLCCLRITAHNDIFLLSLILISFDYWRHQLICNKYFLSGHTMPLTEQLAYTECRSNIKGAEFVSKCYSLGLEQLSKVVVLYIGTLNEIK